MATMKSSYLIDLGHSPEQFDREVGHRKYKMSELERKKDIDI